MAKRNPYSRNRNSSNGRILALLILLALLVVIIWLTRSTTAPKINKDDLDRAMLTQSQANKELKDSTPPSGMTDIQVDPAGLPPPAASESPKTTVESQKTTVEPPKLTQKQEIAPVKTPLVQPDKSPVQEHLANQADRTSGEADKLFATGKTAFEALDYLKARDNLSDAVMMGLSHDQDQQARQMLNTAADHWLFSRSTFGLDEFCRRHKVATGERLANIGINYDVPYELIQRMNNISNPDILRAGQTIKVVQGPFHALVELSKFRLSVFLGDVLVRTYPISIGKPGQARDPEVQGAHDKMIKMALERGVHPRIEIGSFEHAKPFIEMGVRHFCIGWDMFTLAGWCRQQSEGIKELLKSL